MDLKEAARQVGLSGAEIARRMGMTEASVSRWLSRQNIVPAKHVKQLAELLHVRSDDILPPRDTAT
jgi:transcriptional regulator with XRE-family HTH domain